jgi:hypothetical protein
MNKLEEEPSLSLTIFPDSYAKTKKETHLSFGELIVMLENMPTVKNKEDCIYIKLAEFGDTKTPKKCLRHDKNVVSVSGCEIDYDAGVMTVDEAAKIFEANDIESFIYTSASHTKEKPRWRALFPFSEDITGTTEEMKKGRARMVRRIDNLLGGLAANESYTLSQSFYFGVVRAKEEAGLFDMYHSKGRTIDQCDGLPDEIPNSKAPSKTAASANPQIAGVLDNLSGVEPVKGVYTRFDFDKVFDGFSNDTYHQGIVSLTSHYAGLKMPLKDIIANVETSMQTHGEVGSVKYNLRFDEIPDRAQSAIDKFAPDDAKKRAGFSLTQYSDLPVVNPKWLLKGYMTEESINFIYGDSEGLKTFIVLDMACSIATGLNWGDAKKTAVGPVVYLCGEAQSGIQKRIAAWEADRGISLRETQAPLHISGSSIDLANTDNRTVVQNAIDALPEPPVLVIIDTFNRHYSGDENSNTDFGHFLTELDAIIAANNCAILIVHHTGKSSGSGLRGAYAMKGGADSIYQVVRDADVLETTMSCEKIKDAKKPQPITFKAVEHALAVDEDGDEVTSLAVSWTGTPLPSETEIRRFRLLTLLAENPAMSRNDLVEALGLTDGVVRGMLKKIETDNYVTSGGGTRNGRRELTEAGTNCLRVNSWINTVNDLVN